MNNFASILQNIFFTMEKHERFRLLKAGLGILALGPVRQVTKLKANHPGVIGILLCCIAVVLVYSPSFADEIEMFQLINAERQKHGLHPLSYDETLSNSARQHSQDMADRGYFGHQSPSGSTPGSRATQAGYRWASVGETIFAGSTQAGRAVSSLMNSLSHRNIILSSEFCDVGIGLAVERNSEYHAYWTQVFGRRSGTGRCTASSTNPGDTTAASDDGGSGGGCFIAAVSTQNSPVEVVMADPLLDHNSICPEVHLFK